MPCRCWSFWSGPARSCLPTRRRARCWALSEERVGPRPVEDVLWGLSPGTAEPQTLLTGTQRGSPFHATLPAKNGRLLPVEGTYSILNAELREAVIVAHPGGRERAPKSRLMEDVLASIPEAVAIEHGNHVLYTNPAFTRMFGYTAEEAGGGSLRELIVPETRLNEHAALAKAVDEQGRAMVETVRMNKAGELVDVSLQIAPLLVDGAQVGYVFTLSRHRRAQGDRSQAAARRHARRAYGIAEPGAVSRSAARWRSAAACAVRTIAAACCISTWTASRRSTTRWATPRATCC